ncbi:MAG: mechanosensitive ion channel [Methylicorpusculum sp.]|nr:mechanosensitive ion channel [Methylicorpusculum sp.]
MTCTDLYLPCKALFMNRLRLWIAIASVLTLLLSHSEAGAVSLNFNAKQPSKALDAVDLSADPAELIVDIEKRLADTRAELADEQANAQAGKAHTDAPEGLFHRNLFLQILIHAYEVQLERIRDLQDQQKQFVRWQNDSNAQANKDNQTPFSFLFEDDLRETLAIQAKRLDRFGGMLISIEQEAARRISVMKESATKLRQLNEELESSQGDNKALISEKRTIALLKNRLDAIRLLAAQIESQRIKLAIQQITSKRDFAETQRTKFRARSQLTEQDMETVRSNIQAEQKNLVTELEKSAAEIGTDKVPTISKHNSVNSQTQAAIHSIHLLQQNHKETSELKFQGLQSMLEFLQLRQMIWEFRWSSLREVERENARKAYEQIAQWQKNLEVVRDYVKQMRFLALDNATDHLKPSINLTSFEALQTQELQNLDVDRIYILSRLLAVLESNEHLLLRTKQDLDERFQIKSRSERWSELVLSINETASALWEYELFTAEDNIEVDGKKITGKRSITVDKVVTALLILIVGYWIAVKLAVSIEKLSVNRFAMDASLARIAKRWILFVELIILGTMSLMLVHIPLTVFAFMGGAMAIGAGFGMQNLLKNLISGLMLLLERPFRPGDLVEVGGIRGRITDIGMRSSHIRDGNGIETLIPNSTFIEEKVTNWTLSNQSVRIAVKIGVAYGSPVQEVTDILREAAERHGLIEDKPPPQILFEDFGSDALIFGLYVWLELSPEVDWRVVASDLRYIINKKFAARGISMAFPQRDVHLDINQPIDIRVLNNT